MGGELGQGAAQDFGVGEHLAVAGGQLSGEGVQADGVAVLFQEQVAAHPAGSEEKGAVQVACGGPQP